MCKRNKALGLLVTLSLVAGMVLGQTRSRVRTRLAAPAPAVKPAPVKRFVIVHLKQGEPVRGALLRADAELVQLEVQNKLLAINTSEVAQLDFNPAPASAPASAPRVAESAKPVPTATPDPNLLAARQIYQALRKLSDAAKIGLPYAQYASLLIETKASVEDQLAQLPENAVKGESAAALAAYLDAGQAWGAGLATGILPLAIEPGATLAKKYQIKPGVNQLGEEDHLRLDTTLSTIWQEAAKHLDNLGALLNRN
jgi:hypothetical protein